MDDLLQQLDEVRQLVILKHQAGRHDQSTHTPKKYGGGSREILDGRVVVEGDEQFARRVESVLSDVPDWQLTALDHTALERINREEYGLRDVGVLETPDKLTVRHTTKMEQGRARGASTENVLRVNPDLGDDAFKDTLLHELGHHVEVLVASPTLPKSSSSYKSYKLGGDQILSAVRKHEKFRKHQMGVHGASHPAYKRLSAMSRNLFKTVPGKGFGTTSRAKSETFAQAYAMKAQGQELPQSVDRVMNRYFKARPPSNATVFMG